MRILVLGGDGMLGHQLLRQWSPRHEVRVTLRGNPADYATWEIYSPDNSYSGIDVVRFDDVRRVVKEYCPQAIINAVGIVKQRKTAKEAIPSIQVNALFPHQLADLAAAVDARLVHLSTDCVFSGRKGGYSEDDAPDADDLYGRTKLLGEVTEPPGITFRTSIIGREISRMNGLLEWVLSQKGSVRGYRRAIFSGFTTLEMARIVEMVLLEFPQASGLWHVSSEPISKYDLLRMVSDHFDLRSRLEPDDTFSCDRSLQSARFRKAFDYTPPDWATMIAELAKDREFYE